MNTKALAVLVVAAATLAAAGTGAYLAVRQNRADAVAGPAATVAAPLSTETAGVAETEGVLTPTPEAEPAAVEKLTPVPAPTVTRPAASRREPSRAPSAATRRPAPRPTPAAAPEPPVREERIARAEPASAPLPAPAEPVFAPEPQERSVPPPPPVPRFEEITIPADAVIGLQIEHNISSETARVEDRVDARVTRDVRAGGLVAIPAGSRAQGSVTLVERGGKVKERARLGVRFHTLVLADGSRVPIQTETVFREGDSPSKESAAKIGGATVGGAIIGAILGGGKGAAIGGSVGAAGGTAAVMAGSRDPATLASGSTVTVRLAAPATVTVEK
jgi:hypothetical protein